MGASFRCAASRGNGVPAPADDEPRRLPDRIVIQERAGSSRAATPSWRMIRTIPKARRRGGGRRPRKYRLRRHDPQGRPQRSVGPNCARSTSGSARTSTPSSSARVQQRVHRRARHAIGRPAGSGSRRRHNFASIPPTTLISINAAGVTGMTRRTRPARRTTAQRRCSIASTPRAPRAYLSIFDQGDGIYDSAI